MLCANAHEGEERRRNGRNHKERGRRANGSKHMTQEDVTYEPGAALRALSAELDADQSLDAETLAHIKSLIEQDEQKLEKEKAAANATEDEVHELQAQLAEMESESRRLAAILELEQMKASLLGLGESTHPPAAPKSAWGAEALPSSAAPPTRSLPYPKLENASLFASDDDGQLSAADEARLARLMADDDDEADLAFAEQSPSDMAATLAAMERQLADLELQRATQRQGEVDHLAQLKAELAMETQRLKEDEARLHQLPPPRLGDPK